MPEIPIIVPLIVVGLAVGSTIKSKTPRISKKKMASASLAAGLLNSIHAYLLYLLAPTQIPTRMTEIQAAGPTGLEGFASASQAPFIIASFLAAFLIVLLVLGIAMTYARLGRGGELQEAADLGSEEETTLTQS